MRYKAIVITIISFLCFNCTQTANTKTIKLSHGLDVNHSVHKAMLKMGEDLKRISGGKLDLKIYPNQQLGSERENIELLQIGSLDMTKVSVGVLENFAPRLKIFGLPFLFRDRAHAFKVLDGPIGHELLSESEKFWIKGLVYYDAGCRSFYTKDKPIEKPEDLKGLKIRVMESVTAMEMVRSFGGSPTPISSGELYTALQQGVVNGAENNPPTFYASRQYEVCKFYALDEHTIIPDVLLISTQLWERLTAQEQKWVQDAANWSVTYQRKLWADAEIEALEKVQESGVKILRPDKSLFKEKVQNIYAEYETNAEIKKLIQYIQDTK